MRDIFLKQRIDYSASRANENGMWGPSATLQDVCTPVNMLQAERRCLPMFFFQKKMFADGWGGGVGNKFLMLSSFLRAA